MVDQPESSPLDWPFFTEEDINAAVATMRSGRVNQWTGNQVRHFEDEFAGYCGVRHGVCVANGTLALELALHALDLTPDDEVVVTSRTHFSSVSSIVRAGLRPVFADVDPVTQNVTAATLEAVMTERTAALLVVHLGGWPAPMEQISRLAEDHDVRLVEDCSQAHGARLNGRSVGSWGDVAAFSFCHEKILTTGGEGGIVLTEQNHLRDRLWSCRDHGKNRARALSAHDGSAFRWLHDEFGSNYRMSEIAASIGRSQLRRLDAMVSRRRDLAHALRHELTDTPGILLPDVPTNVEHSYYRYYFRVNPAELGEQWNRDRILSELNRHGVQAGVGSCPEVYKERAFLEAAMQPMDPLPVACDLGTTSIALSIHSRMPVSVVTAWAREIDSIMRAAISAVNKPSATARVTECPQSGAESL